MAKLILSFNGAVLSEHELDKDSISIGRRPSNDIQIDNLAVSGEHAAIRNTGGKWFLQDANSTNGTLVNSIPIKQHVLKHKDVIEFGNHQLTYIDEAVVVTPPAAVVEAEDFEKTMVFRPGATPPAAPAVEAIKTPPPAPPSAPPPAATAAPATPTLRPVVAPAAAAVPPVKNIAPQDIAVARIQVLNGPSIGKELLLNKALTTLGKPGVQVAVITKRSQGYFITHVDGKSHPSVNDLAIGVQAHMLNNLDVIELAGVKMKFYQGAA
jgi:hypothetical protein